MRSYVARSGVKEYETTLPLKEGQLRDRTPIRGGDAYLVFDDLDWDWSLVTPLNVSYENEYGKTAVSTAEIFEQEGQNKVIRSLIPAAITETLSPLTASLSVTVNGKTTLLQTTISMNGIDAINDLTIGDLRAGKVTVYGDIYDQKNGERNISQIITNLQSGILVVSVKETEIKYGRNNSPTVAPETGWFNEPPAATEGEYLWTRTKWIYSNGTSKSSYSVVKDGKSSYLHTAWANSSDGTVDFSKTSSVGRSYIGTYSDSNEAGSSTPSKYKWVKATGTAVVGVASKNLWEPDRLITNLTNRGLRFQIDNPVRIHSLKVYSTESGYIDLVIKKSNGTAVFNSSYQVEKGEQTLTLELQLTDVGEYTITKTGSLSLSYHTTMESEFPFNSGTFKITASTGDSYTKTRYYYFYDWVVSGEGVIAKTPDLWSIGADGCWYLNGVKTAKKAIGVDGTGIKEHLEYYLATSQGTGVTTDHAAWNWTEIPQQIDEDNKFLWNYSTTEYTNGVISTESPVIIGLYGTDGRGIKGVKEYYLISSLETGVTYSSGDWTTIPPNVTKTNPFLWNYEEIFYTDDTSSKTKPALVGVRGDDGADGTPGTGVKSMIVEYAIGGTTEPTSWTTTPPDTWEDGQYLWTRYKITYTDDEIKYTGANRLSDVEAQRVLAKAQELVDETREVIEARLDDTDHTILAIANDQTVSPLEEMDLRNLITQMEVDTSILIAKNNGVNDTSFLTTAGDNLKTFILDALSTGSYAEINLAEFNDLYQTYKNEEATLENLIKDTEEKRYTGLETGQVTLGTRIGSYEEQLKLKSGLIAMYIDRGYGLEQAMTLARDELAFYLDKQRKAWIGLNGLNADNATIGQSAHIGNHEFQKFGTDYTIINWVGE